MMQSYASAAKLRGGGPILFLGTKAMAQAGTPPPRTVIGDPSQADGLGPKLSGVFSDLLSLRRAQNDAIRHHAFAHQSPQGDQKFARQGHDHGLASTAGILGTGSKPLRQGAVLLKQEKSQANWIMPRRTRALPERASPFSRRFVPLSSGEPVRPA